MQHHGTVPSSGTAPVGIAVSPEGQEELSRPLSWAERARSRALSGPPSSPEEQPKERVSTAKPTQKYPTAPPDTKVKPPLVPAFAFPTKEKPVVVLDAGALLRVEALDRHLGKFTFVTTAEASQEVRDALTRRRIEGRFLDIRTLQPTAADLGWAEKFASMTGDLPFLSATDLGIIALTYMLQRATGQTQRLKLQPPAFEFFNEAEFRSKLESDGCSKHVWTLQRTNTVNGSSDRLELSGKVSDGEQNESELPGGTEVSDETGKAKSASDSESDEDMDDEEGWVTQDVLRDHLGLIDGGIVQESSGITDSNADDRATSEALCDAFSGLELRAHLQEVEDLVTCMTTDFTIQNVLLQMGLGVLAVDGRRIKTVKVWALLCRACGHIERKTKLLFCPKCGHYTLDRAPLYFDQSSGKVYVFDGRKKISKRGQVYSIPKDTRGKHSRPIILAADQLLMGGLDRELRHKEKLWKKDVESKDPFSPNYCLEAQSWHVRAFTASGRAAAAPPPKVVVGLGPGNPNSNRWMKQRARQRK